MREIKFRGKRIDNGEWVYGFLFELSIDGCSITCIGTEPLSANDYSEIYKSCYEEVIPETVGQYTGLKDKNGKEIYGGDIVLCKIHDKEYMGLVEYTNTYGFYYLSGMGRSDTELWGCNERKVIGNIYEGEEAKKTAEECAALEALRWRDAEKEPPEEELVVLSDKHELVFKWKGEWFRAYVGVKGSETTVRAWIPLPEYYDEEYEDESS